MGDNLGYLGAIHHFKNYVLRGTPANEHYYHLAKKSLLEGVASIDALGNGYPEYAPLLPKIRHVFLEYIDQLDNAKIRIQEGLSPKEVDSYVKVNDRPALEAKKEIEALFEKQKVEFQDIHHEYFHQLRFMIIAIFISAGFLFSIIMYSHQMSIEQMADEKLELANSKDEFVRKMAHEIRTPLNAMLGFQEFLHLEEMRPDDQENLKHIKESSVYLLTLINDILDFSKLKAKKFELQPEPVDEGAFWHSIKMIGLGLKKEEQEFRVNTPESLTWIRIDEVRLRQILLNLLSNSFKFTPPTGTISITVHNEKGDGKDFMRFEVQDSGEGMTKDELANIFTEYYQVSGQVSGHQGTGLGLNITRTLVELMNGSIDVDSIKGKGTTFTIKLPRVIESQENILVLEEASGKSPLIKKEFDLTGLKEQKVLVVEDTPINQKLMIKYYKKLGLPAPMIAEDGLVAIKMVSEHRPDLIFMDLLMPNLGGIEATIRIRKEFDYDPIIIGLSANVESKRECLEAGMNDFIPKPLQRSTLKEILNTYRPQRNKKSA